jgi:peroxiredoxin
MKPRLHPFRLFPVSSSVWTLCLLLLTGFSGGDSRGDDTAAIKGQVFFDPARLQSWNGGELKIPFEELPVNLYQQVELAPIPFPENWASMTAEEQQAWAIAFEESEAGKKFLDERDAMLDAARDFQVLLEKDGKFVVYDVPVGVYDLRGFVDKEIKEIVYRFEVFGRLEVVAGLDEVRLNPIPIEVTPLLQQGLPAPTFELNAAGETPMVKLDTFAGNYLLIGFWVSNSPNAAFQQQVQQVFGELQDKHPLRLLSICVDDDREQGLKFIAEQNLAKGTHAFTEGFSHRTLFDYGIRSIPSLWLIDPNGKIALSQFDFGRAFLVGNDLTTIVGHTLEGKPIPNLPVAEPEKEGDRSESQSTIR